MSQWTPTIQYIAGKLSTAMSLLDPPENARLTSGCLPMLARDVAYTAPGQHMIPAKQRSGLLLRGLVVQEVLDGVVDVVLLDPRRELRVHLHVRR